jgi:hypothetical protein
VIETVLQRLILAQVPLRRPHVRVWRSNVVLAKVGNGFVRSLPDGYPDITGIISRCCDDGCEHCRGGGRMLAIEVKQRNGRRSPEQITWGEWLTAAGACYVVARSLDDVLGALA